MKVTEDVFYSIQGEGATVGAPSVFIRFGNCMFQCAWCDTIKVWKNFTEMSETDLLSRITKLGLIPPLVRGCHLILTGGEPLLQQKSLPSFIEQIDNKAGSRVYVEVETAGVIEPSEEMLDRVDQWNISPKLSNSGIPLKRRRKLDVLSMFRDKNSWLKFPVQNEIELDEVLDYWVGADFPKERVLLMPVCDTQASHLEKSLEVIEWCKDYGYRYSPRMQLALYNESTGV